MLLSALVLDTNSFPYTGKIKVRIQKFCVNQIKWDMVDDPKAVLDGYTEDGDNSDYDVYVMSPFGVGKNCSMFWLPRVNSKGLVSPLGHSNSKEFVWVGGYFDEVINKDNSSSITVPSQSADSNKYGINDGFSDSNNNAFVFRTKTTSVNQDYSQINSDSFNWDKNLTENLIIIDGAKIQVRHFSEYNSDGTPIVFEDIFIGENILEKNKDGTVKKKESVVKIEVKNNKVSGKEKTNTFILSDLGTTLNYTNYETKVNNLININSSDISMITTTGGKKTTIYKQRGEDVKITSENTVISINKDEISLVADKTVILSAKEVRLGGGDGKILTTKSIKSSLKSADGEIIIVNDKVRC